MRDDRHVSRHITPTAGVDSGLALFHPDRPPPLPWRNDVSGGSPLVPEGTQSSDALHHPAPALAPGGGIQQKGLRRPPPAAPTGALALLHAPLFLPSDAAVRGTQFRELP